MHLIASNRTLGLTPAQTMRIRIISYYRNLRKGGLQLLFFAVLQALSSCPAGFIIRLAARWLQLFWASHPELTMSEGRKGTSFSCDSFLRSKGTFLRYPLASHQCPILFSGLNHMIILKPIPRSKNGRDNFDQPRLIGINIWSWI